MRKQFRDTVLSLAQDDDSIVLLFGDISVYLFEGFKQKHPSRFFNMGICENTLISAAAGMSACGFTPFVHSIAPFLTERSFEQLKLDMSYNRFSGNVVTCGATFDYAWDGATHHCLNDLAILRLLPGIEVLQPGSRKELDVLLRSQYKNDRLTYFRLSDHPHTVDLPVEFGKGVVVRDEKAPLTVLTAGPLLQNVLDGCAGLPVNIVYFHTIKPIDRAVIERFKDTRLLVIHDAFGLYEAVCETPYLKVKYFGLPDAFFSCYGKLEEVRKSIGLDAAGIAATVRKELERT